MSTNTLCPIQVSRIMHFPLVFPSAEFKSPLKYVQKPTSCRVGRFYLRQRATSYPCCFKLNNCGQFYQKPWLNQQEQTLHSFQHQVVRRLLRVNTRAIPLFHPPCLLIYDNQQQNSESTGAIDCTACLAISHHAGESHKQLLLLLGGSTSFAGNALNDFPPHYV